jgi:hypothetical protein
VRATDASRDLFGSDVAPESNPQLSVVIATDSYAAIRKVLRCFRAQGDPARLEIVIASLAGAQISPDAPELRGFPHVRIVEVDDEIDIARAEAEALPLATADYVVLAETCSYPRPGFVDAIVEACRSQKWAVVGPAATNANPDSDTSWAGMIINYGRFFPADDAGPARMVPGHDSAYRREVLSSLGGELGALVRSLSALQTELRARGHQLYREPAARVEMLNVSRPGWFLIDQFGKGRQFAWLRRRYWSRVRSLLYAAGSPLIPLIRLLKALVILRARGEQRDVLRGARPVLLLGGLLAGAAGECAGYLFGERAAPGFYERNLHRPRYVREEDARRDADESTWPV